MLLPPDYLERVYAGVLGKIIGVYLGRPFENWTYERILAELGEVRYYVHEHFGLPLVVTDDDISGTFTFLRALADYENGRKLTPQQIGQTWLNYIVENQSILWWGGMGNSTEHTAFLRLKDGIAAPRSGSIAVNGKTVAEQIGAQIFIDGWGMLAPGDPELAAEFARKAASVSHDGEAIYGAQVLAAMEAQAFVERDLNKLLDIAVTFIPRDSIIYRLISDLRDWRLLVPDWHAAREKIAAHYGYDKYPGNCHIVPNHALVQLALLYGEDNFQKSLMIVNTSGWDTDCNSGNIGCLMGIRNGLGGIDCGPDWRGPIADRIYLPTADGGRCISDAVLETFRIVNLGRGLIGEEPVMPKNGARFHFELPGSVQGFQVDAASAVGDVLRIENVRGHSRIGTRSLSLRFQHLAMGRGICITTPTFIRPADLNMPGYPLHASPTLYPGQVVRAELSADVRNISPVTVSLYISVYGANDQPRRVYGPQTILVSGGTHLFEWKVPDPCGQPILEVGFELVSTHSPEGTVWLDYLTWDGEPDVTLKRPDEGGTIWRRAWINGVSTWDPFWPESFRPVQNRGRGMLIQGTREWKNYRLEADIKPLMFTCGGIASRVQGLERYYALLLCQDEKLRLVKALDGVQVLAEVSFAWETGKTYVLALETTENRIRAEVDGQVFFDILDTGPFLDSGAIALVVDEGCMSSNAVSVKPWTQDSKKDET
jgi:ADP-ribosylglycohydrolase